MLRETSNTIESTLGRLQNSTFSTDEKLLVAREIFRITLPPESRLIKELDKTEELPHDSPEREKLLASLVSSARLLLPFYTDVPSPTVSDSASAGRSADLGRQIETEVRLSLEEKFWSSTFFKAVVAALFICVTLFSFGLFSLSRDVKQADAVVDAFRLKLSEADSKVASQEKNIDDRFRAANEDLAKRIEKAQEAERDAQANAMNALNKNLSDRVKEVEASKESAKAEINISAKNATGVLDAERDQQKAEVHAKAEQIVRELREPTVHTVLGRAFYLMLVTMSFSLLSLVIACVAWSKAR